jgi:hypothetical protein
MTIGAHIASANTPVEAKESGAFSILSTLYDTGANNPVRKFVDTHYVKNPIFKGDGGSVINPNIFTNWREYRFTVMAFARRDPDPMTPDQSRGVSSIQVTFRDWIVPWINLEYLPGAQIQVDGYVELLGGAVGSSVSAGQALDGVTDQVIGIVGNAGVVGKLQRYTALNQALGQVNVDQPYAASVIQTVGDAINLQIVQSNPQSAFVGTAGAAGEVAFRSHVRAAAAADSQIGGVQSELASLGGNIEAQVNDAVNTRVGELDAEGGALHGIRQQIGGVSGQVEALVNLGDGSIDNIRARLLKADDTAQRLDNFLLQR